MGQRITREELHALVWAEPMRKLAGRFGISDVALKKGCRRMHVPVPPRGHWARKAAGKTVTEAALPPRPPGLNNETTIGGGRYRPYHPPPSTEELLEPPPPEPSFGEPIEGVRKRVEAAIGKVAVPKDLDDPHPVVAELLRQDEDRRRKQHDLPYASSLYTPLYDGPIQRRRLRLVSAILLAAARCGCKADAWNAAPFGEPVTRFVVRVHGQSVCLRVAIDGAKRRSGKGTAARATTRQMLKVELCPADGEISAVRVWRDGDEAVERRIREIAAAVVVRAEEQYRSEVVRSHRWRVQQRAELIERMRREREEAERKERERRAELERKRVQRLLEQAEAFRRAREIRHYVEAVRAANGAATDPLPEAEMNAWARWALAQADRLDPVENRAYLEPDKGDTGADHG